jgi:plastocyanin
VSRRRRTTIAVVVLAALGACGGDDSDTATRANESAATSQAADSTAEVTIVAFDFQPDPITIEAGTTITFRNRDKINHSVTAGTRDNPDPSRFEGVMEGAGDSFELTLDTPGTYDYFCKFHPGPGMTGSIVVTAPD